MATYKGIKGVKVVSKASDPTVTEAIGTVWYNTTSTALKYAIQGTGAWASGTSAPTAGNQSGGAGISTAFLMWGGSAPGNTNLSYKFNGTAWTSTNNLVNNQSGTMGVGTETAAMGCGGYNDSGYNNRTEEFNGTSWANVNVDANTPQVGYKGLCGTQTSALSAGGYGSPPGQVDKCSEYDGTNWTAATAYPSAKSNIFAIGTQTAALMVGGNPPIQSAGFDYNGTSWTAGAAINTARTQGQNGGLTSAGMIAGGQTPSNSVKTESYNGTSWSEVGDLGTARGVQTKGYTGTGDAQSSFIVACGNAPAKSNTVEIWSDPVYAIKTVTVS